jgi:STE24 endopeptidase
MTATRIVRGSTIAVAAAVWAVLAMLLWRTSVPGGLRLPHLDEERVFGRELVRDAERYERFLELDWLLGTVAAILVLVWFVRRGPRLARSLGLGSVNAGIITGIVVTTALWAVAMPFGVAGAWWERRHGISVDSWHEILLAPWAALVGVSFGTLILLAVVLLLAKRLTRTWWIGAALAFAALGALVQFLFPYWARLGTKAPPPRLAAEVRKLERRERAGHPLLRIEAAHERTRAANAYAVGIGPTKTVVLWDTLLDGRFGRDEVRFAAAHELAHHARDHLWKAVAWGALIGAPLLAAVALVTGRRGGLRAAGTVPLALLTLTLGQLAISPFENAVSRRYEAEADWLALRATHDADAARRLFRGFSKIDLQDPEPAAWAHLLLDTHPSALERVEMAEAFRRGGR